MPIGSYRTARVALIAALPLMFMAAMPVADGVTYDFVMKSTSKATGNKETVTMRGRGIYAGDDAKIEILEASAATGGQGSFGGKGAYFILRNAGQEMLLVDPEQKSYMQWDLANMFAGMSKVVNAVGGLVKMQMSDIKIEAHDMGAGPSIEGYPTRQIRMVQNYTITASIFGRSNKSRSETTTDYFFAPTLHIANPFVSNSQAMAMMSQLDMFNNPDYKSQMAAANAKLPRSGVPLRTVTTTVTTDEKGKQETSTNVMEMVNFKPGHVAASEFAIPSGYKKVEMPSFNTADGAAGAKGPDAPNVDSLGAKAKEGAKEGAKEAAKGAAKDAATKKLKGIFHR